MLRHHEGVAGTIGTGATAAGALFPIIRLFFDTAHMQQEIL
jgi:hypothetical protein